MTNKIESIEVNKTGHWKIVDLFIKWLQLIKNTVKSNVKLLLLSGFFIVMLLLSRLIVWQVAASNNHSKPLSEESLQAVQQKLETEIGLLNKKLQSKLPKSYYLIINSTTNEFSLINNGELIRKDKCSTGSYVLLKGGDDQEWMFKTPKGEFKILGKNTAPVWKKPDWAFVEDGLPIPSSNHSSRFEYGVLGDFSLSLGKGYLIHGTLYQRFLGLPVTHGCIRLNDENLELVYRSLQVGSKVYIY